MSWADEDAFIENAISLALFRAKQEKLKTLSRALLIITMKDFPVLKKKEVALLRAEKATGILLDEFLKRAVSDNQETYTVFTSFIDAKTYADNLLSLNNEIEIIIYSNKDEVLFYSNE